MRVFRKSNMYSTEAMVWESMLPEITSSKNFENIKNHELDWMTQEGLHRGILIKIRLTSIIVSKDGHANR